MNHSNLTEEDITSLEDLGIVGDRNIDEEIWEETIQNYMDILIILRNNGIDIEDIARNLENKDYEKTSLKDLNQLGVDMESILDQNNIDSNLNIGEILKELKAVYKKKKSSTVIEEARSKIDELGLFKSSVTRTLDMLEILKLNSIDVSKIQMIIRRDGKRRSSMLKEINQPGIDIMRIIDENGLNPEDNIGIKIAWINQLYKGTAKGPLTSKERKKAEELGIIRGELSVKEKEQQELKTKLEKVQLLRDDAKTAINKTSISK